MTLFGCLLPQDEVDEGAPNHVADMIEDTTHCFQLSWLSKSTEGFWVTRIKSNQGGMSRKPIAR